MKKLSDLINCDIDVLVNDIKVNSKDVLPGDAFICVDFNTKDRHKFIDDAIARGASCIIARKQVPKKSVPVLVVDNPNKILNEICSKLYDNPEKKLTMIGVTGTDGKTSVSTIIQTLLGNENCGYIGTNGYNCAAFNRDAPNTTPSGDKLFRYFHEFLESGCSYCSMEVSSEGLMRGRVDKIDYDISILTNITSEHLNIHGDLQSYVHAKCELFRKTKKDGYSILNIDDKHFEEVMKACNGHILTYGSKSNADLYFYDIELFPTKTNFKFKYLNKEYSVETPFPGLFNVYNLSAAMLALFALGYDFDYIKKRIPLIKVSGRLEMIDLGQDFHVMVDYAHTPNGITKLLEYVKLLPINRSIVVIGQAGERDPYKRKEVGEIVARNCDYAIFTYEDPRSEDPRDIIDMMTQNIHDLDNYEVIIDRKEAIKRAIELAQPNDMVMVLGKGNETYEKLKDKVIYFNDIEEVKKDLKERLEVHS